MVPEPEGGVVAVFAAALLRVALVELLEELEELELPHAARPKPSSAQLASAPIFF